MRHLALFGLTTVLGLSTLLTLPSTPVWADDEVDLEEGEGVTMAPIAPYPRHPETSIDLVKPPTLLSGAGYQATWSTLPETIQVSEPFTIDLTLMNGDATAPLAIEPGTTVDILMQQRRGYCGLLIPVTVGADGIANVPEMLILPYSGGYEAWLYFTPAGTSEPITERIAMFVEGVAENGKDITAMPRTDGPWDTMPRYTKEVNRFVNNPIDDSAPKADNETIAYKVVDFDLANLLYADLANHQDAAGRATLLLQSDESYIFDDDNPRDQTAVSSFDSDKYRF
jgi:hypothetical protein